MKSTLSLLALTSALGAFMAVPVAARGVAPELLQSAPGQFAPDLTAADLTADLLLFADNDSDDDSEGEDDDGEGDDDEGCGYDDGGDDDGQPCTNAQNPAAMGKKAPPKNGLFGNGAAPKAKVN